MLRLLALSGKAGMLICPPWGVGQYGGPHSGPARQGARCHSTSARHQLPSQAAITTRTQTMINSHTLFLDHDIQVCNDTVQVEILHVMMYVQYA